jgi:hypothetical protein
MHSVAWVVFDKIQIEVEYAYSRRSEHDAIFWVTADDMNILAEEFACITGDLGLEDAREAEDLTMASELVKIWLSDPIRSYDTPSSLENEASWLVYLTKLKLSMS